MSKSGSIKNWLNFKIDEEDLKTIEKALNNGQKVIIVGSERSGKTSFMESIAKYSNKHTFIYYGIDRGMNDHSIENMRHYQINNELEKFLSSSDKSLVYIIDGMFSKNTINGILKEGEEFNSSYILSNIDIRFLSGLLCKDDLVIELDPVGDRYTYRLNQI